jgi:hypothetical protein
MGKKSTKKGTDMPSRLDRLAKAAETYGDRSFQNYSQVRNVAETLRDSFCKFLDEDEQCVYLVPPQGPFAAQNSGSAAFSVWGKGFLPLEPISFGLAVAISKKQDYMRLVLTCRKEGEQIFINVEKGREYELSLPLNDIELGGLMESLYEHVFDYFQGQVDAYDNGHYGKTDIGFDIQRVSE